MWLGGKGKPRRFWGPAAVKQLFGVLDVELWLSSCCGTEVVPRTAWKPLLSGWNPGPVGGRETLQRGGWILETPFELASPRWFPAAFHPSCSPPGIFGLRGVRICHVWSWFASWSSWWGVWTAVPCLGRGGSGLGIPTPSHRLVAETTSQRSRLRKEANKLRPLESRRVPQVGRRSSCAVPCPVTVRARCPKPTVAMEAMGWEGSGGAEPGPAALGPLTPAVLPPRRSWVGRGGHGAVRHQQTAISGDFIAGLPRRTQKPLLALRPPSSPPPLCFALAGER